jgi:hypothetical protein
LGAEQQLTFDEIKKNLSLPLVMKALEAGIPFRLYITAKDKLITAVLTQVTDDNVIPGFYVKTKYSSHA